MSNILVPYTKTKNEVMVYSQNTHEEFTFLYDLMDDANREIIDREKQILSLKAENEKLRECVEFYADGANWHDNNVESCYVEIRPIDRTRVQGGVFYGGKFARQILEGLK